MTHSLIGELEEAIQSGSKEKRVETLRRVTDLFLNSSDRLTEKQVDVFDDVLGHLIKNIESRALIELSCTLAPVENAPLDVIRKLANDDDVLVAGPVLSQSMRLTANDLVGIVNTKSQAHLLAVSGRSHIEEVVTSALVERGDQHVLQRLSSNPGARFTSEGFSSLLRKADQNETILQALGLRADFPLKLLQELLARASDALRERLISGASFELQNSIRNILARFTSEVDDKIVQRKSDAEAAIQELNRRGELKEPIILKCATRGEREEVIAALALMNGSQFDVIEKIFESTELEAVLVPCMAAGLKWNTVRAVVQLKATPRSVPESEMTELSSAYAKLSAETAQRTLRFWQVRNKLTG